MKLTDEQREIVTQYGHLYDNTGITHVQAMEYYNAVAKILDQADPTRLAQLRVVLFSWKPSLMQEKITPEQPTAIAETTDILPDCRTWMDLIWSRDVIFLREAAMLAESVGREAWAEAIRESIETIAEDD